MTQLTLKQSVNSSVELVSESNPLPVKDVGPGRRQWSYEFYATGALSRQTSLKTDFPGARFEVVMVEAVFSSAPTTSQNFTLTRNRAAGTTTYDTTLYSVNPSAGAVTSIVNTWDPPYPLGPGDEVTVAFTNTDARTIGGRIVVREVL